MRILLGIAQPLPLHHQHSTYHRGSKMCPQIPSHQYHHWAHYLSPRQRRQISAFQTTFHSTTFFVNPLVTRVQRIEFCPTPLPQTPQGHFPLGCPLRAGLARITIIFVLPIFTLRPFASISDFHTSNFLLDPP